MLIAEQARVWMTMALCGVFLGGIYDAMGLLRRGTAVWAVDLIYGPLCALAVIGTALALQTDAFRLYVCIACALGMTAYRMTIGTIVRGMTAAVRKMIKKREKSDENLQNDAGKQSKRANVN